MASNEMVPSRLVIAIGGNATHPEGIRGSPGEQVKVAAELAEALLPLMLLDTELIITHGNGPVVGKILLRQAIARQRVEPMSLDICVAHTQGGIAYLLMQAFENVLRAADNPRHVICLLTQVEVDPDDPAFKNPSKPIGYFYSEEEAKGLTAELGWEMREDSGRGWRHVVPSPRPKHIADISLIEVVAKSGAVVIAGGGGGVPVVRSGKRQRHGVEAVIDKDQTSALMANVLHIDDLMILTAVPRVAIHYGKPQQQELERVTLAEIKKLHAEGHFPPGSMGPKIEAAIQFLDRGGRRVMIGRLQDVMPVLCGKAGTHIVAD
ncbi:MAG: carbamate kinase [Hyphomicrobiales bacterium]|nr:carbamate kinase [Hyphomicrobiales bacterium]